MAQSAVGPACDEERLAVRVEKNAIRAAPSFESLDQHTRLRVDHHHGILEQIRGIDEPSIGRECDVANEIVHSALGFRHDREDAPWREYAIRVLEFQNRSARATTHIHKIAFRRECEP